jgi:hypothetical protein
MILVRNVFRLKYGQARPALALWKEGLPFIRRAAPAASPRLLTDVVGPAYTLVMEDTYKDLASFEQSGREAMASDQWRAWYQKFVPLVESGYREIFTIVDS